MSSNKNFFLHFQQKTNTNLDKKIDLILSCEYYWCRIFTIPTTSPKEALKILPSLFEDFVPNIQQLDFYIIKLDKNSYLSFAYNREKIILDLKKHNLTLSNINAIYFAQNEFIKFKSTQEIFCVDGIYFQYIDNILVQLPPNLNINKTNIKQLSIDELTLSKHKIYLQFGTNYIDQKYSYLLSFVFVLLSLIFSAKIYTNYNTTKQISNQINQIKIENKLPKTQIETRSIIQTLQHTQTIQNNLREAFYFLLSNFKKYNIKINYINISKDNIIFQIENKSFKLVKSFLYNKYKIIKKQNNNNKLTIKIAI